MWNLDASKFRIIILHECLNFNKNLIFNIANLYSKLFGFSSTAFIVELNFYVRFLVSVDNEAAFAWEWQLRLCNDARLILGAVIARIACTNSCSSNCIHETAACSLSRICTDSCSSSRRHEQLRLKFWLSKPTACMNAMPSCVITDFNTKIIVSTEFIHWARELKQKPEYSGGWNGDKWTI